MKLSKLLLSAIVAGVTVTATTSCSKKDKEVTPQSSEQKDNVNPVVTPYNCPACGMG